MRSCHFVLAIILLASWDIFLLLICINNDHNHLLLCSVSQDNVQGMTCNMCKPGTFYLSARSIYGCLECVCMGITDQCTSSTWGTEIVSFVSQERYNILNIVSYFAPQLKFIQG